MRVESSRYQLTILLFAKLSWPLGGETKLAVACGRCLGGLFERCLAHASGDWTATAAWELVLASASGEQMVTTPGGRGEEMSPGWLRPS